MTPVLLLGDGIDDRGRDPGTAGERLDERKWGPLHVLVAFILRKKLGIEFAFLRPLPPAACLRDPVGRHALPRAQQFLSQFQFFLQALEPAKQRGLVVIINDQDCESRRLQMLEADARKAALGMPSLAWISGNNSYGRPDLALVTAVSVECTESWLLCGDWPNQHRDCLNIAHPGQLGCVNNTNRAKHIFDQLHKGEGGWQVRRDRAQHITRDPQATAYQQLRQTRDFHLLEDRLETAMLAILWV